MESESDDDRNHPKTAQDHASTKMKSEMIQPPKMNFWKMKNMEILREFINLQAFSCTELHLFLISVLIRLSSHHFAQV